MPELPEVQTIVSDLGKILPGLKIGDVWTDFKKMFKNGGFENFKKEVLGEKISSVERRGKNILITLSGNKTILIHQKMTGHLMYGKWRMTSPRKGISSKWQSEEKGPMRDDPMNRFIRIVFSLSDGKQLALSDIRKFAKVLIWRTDKLSELKDIKDLGIEPFDKKFTLKKFREMIENKRGKIKQVLMDQNFIAGIGNIYSDEILWLSGIHPLKEIQKLNAEDVKKIYKSIRPILKKAIKARGSSNNDYRDASGREGKYQNMQNAYRKTGEKCKKGDGGIIAKIKIGGRSAHFCPTHQKLNS